MNLKILTAKELPFAEALGAIRDFLQESLPEVHRVNVTKLAQIDADEGTWEAEAEVWQPNDTVKNLGLPTQKPVLDQQEYLLRLDSQLNVLAYALKESISEQE